METKTASTLTKKDAAQLMGAALHLEALSELMRGYSPEQGGLSEVSVKALGGRPNDERGRNPRRAGTRWERQAGYRIDNAKGRSGKGTERPIT